MKVLGNTKKEMESFVAKCHKNGKTSSGKFSIEITKNIACILQHKSM
jgi:hypothetical protein